MTASVHRTDSIQIAALRARFKLEVGEHASPYRLGTYARARGIEITDFGAHSMRWVKAFKQGLEPAGTARTRALQLMLFDDWSEGRVGKWPRRSNSQPLT